MNISDRILVMFEGEIVGEFDPKETTVEQIGLYMAGAKRNTPRTGSSDTSHTKKQDRRDEIS